MNEHCANFDASYDGCRECPGKVMKTNADGSVDTICRAGEKALRELIASSEIPTAENDVQVFPIVFPAPHRATM